LIIEALATFVTATISHVGYWGVFFLMFLESACIPIPSEVIMPFSGFLVVSGQFTLLGVTVIGALGNLLGSILAYWVGYRGGRPLIEKYGKYILISHHDLDRAEHFFQKYGEATTFFSRMLPIIRTFISLPAGIAKMDFKKFVIYTFLGALPFSLLLAWAGVQLGERWDALRPYFHKFDLVIALALVLFVAWWIWRHIRNSKTV
jgi:membrane protein DedA with SNARE-associated domain